jgi:cyclic pyranopterin phosphate synthase
MSKFSHIDSYGKAKMVDISSKGDTRRTAIAHAKITMNKEAFTKLKKNEIEKGDVLTVAKIAGINAGKKTSELIPLCHQLNLTNVKIEFKLLQKENAVEIFAEINLIGKTGAEMESLTAVSVSALTIYDMCKAIDKGIVISEIYLLEKSGGKSGDFKRMKDKK